MARESYDCFLSYSSLDVGVAEVVHQRLVTVGFSVWWDTVYLHAGMQWQREIERHCEISRVVLPILTANWKESLWTRYETYSAAQVIPLLVRGEWRDVATPPLGRYQALAMSIHAATEADWAHLFERIRECCAGEPPDRARRVAHLQHRPIAHFVGREEMLAEIHEKLFTNPTTALTHGRVEAITALGGVGKTTIARHYAETFWRCYRQMFWVDCRSGLESGFAQIHDALRPEAAPSRLTVTQKAEIAKRELSQSCGEQRLLILDDAVDEESVKSWIPSTGNCHTIITSRFTAWSKGIETCPVWVLEPGPARELLLRRSGRVADDAADRLAEKVGYLPLALEQAAAYVGQQTGFGFREYLPLYEANERQFLERKEAGATDYPESVYFDLADDVGEAASGGAGDVAMACVLCVGAVSDVGVCRGGGGVGGGDWESGGRGV